MEGVLGMLPLWEMRRSLLFIHPDDLPDIQNAYQARRESWSSTNSILFFRHLSEKGLNVMKE